jgi:hypothetical protein
MLDCCDQTLLTKVQFVSNFELQAQLTASLLQSSPLPSLPQNTSKTNKISNQQKAGFLSIGEKEEKT